MLLGGAHAPPSEALAVITLPAWTMQRHLDLSGQFEYVARTPTPQPEVYGRAIN